MGVGRVISENDLAALTARIAELRGQIKTLTDALELMDSYVAYLRQPDDAGLVQNAVAVTERQNKPMPDDLQERSLRLLLRDHPHDLGLSRALIALLYRTGRPLFPELPAIQSNRGGYDDAAFEELLNAKEDYARAGDTFGVYATLWQLCVRYPQTARGWAEFARCLAERGEWTNCRQAVAQVFNAGCFDPAAEIPTLSALSILAENGKLGSLDWSAWIQQLSPALQAHPDTVRILMRQDMSGSAATVISSTKRLWPNAAETWIAATMAACEADDLEQAYDCIRNAFKLNPTTALRAVVGDLGERFAAIMRKVKRYDEIADWLSGQWAEGDAMNIVAPSPAPEAKRAVQTIRRTAMDRGLPSVLLATQNKSASIAVGNIFSSGFELPTVLYSLVNIRIISPWLRDYLEGGACYVTHLLPSPRNVDLLVAAGAPSIIVHVRDPRQWVLSMAAHTRLYAHITLPSWRETALGGPAGSIAFVIRELLPEAIAWTEGWL